MKTEFKPSEMKVLLVDDQMSNIQVLTATLQPVGYQLAFALSGEQMLDIAQQFNPDLVLLDIMMPGIDGIESCRRLKANSDTANIPVIFATAKSESDDIVKGFEVGGVDYITKPYNCDELSMRTRTQLMLRYTMLNLEANNVLLTKYQEKLEDLVKQRTASLEASNKELETYNYSLSHDLLTPLRSIVSFSQILAEEAADKLNNNEKSHLNRILNAGQRMSHLYESTQKLFLVTKATLHCESINLSEICQSIVSALQNIHSDKEVKCTIDSDIIVYGDEHLIQVVMEQLINNAWKFSLNTANATIEIGSYEEKHSSICFVKDKGIGFEMQYANKLFKAFSCLHTSEGYQGIGSGLVIVQRIINRHGGKVWAEGKPNAGATFYFSLPNNNHQN